VKLTKQRKIFASILGLAALAFLGDRLLMQPEGPGSVTDAAPQAEKAEPSHPVSSKAQKSDGGPSLASRLNAIPSSEAATNRDPFRKGWKPAAGVVSSPGSKAKGGIAETAADFLASHHLTGVSTPRTGISVAVLDKKAYLIGELVDGWKVAAIEGASGMQKDYKPARVTLERGTQRVTMEVQVLAAADNHKRE